MDGLRITTNILSLSAQRNLAVTTRAIARSLERLSSGYRINTARNDPAGLAIANGLEAQRRGLFQAARNINNSKGILDTADGALAEQTNIVQRMRELAVQSANGTHSEASRQYLNIECQQLFEEFKRITAQTEFNGVHLLDGSFGTKNLQVSNRKGDTIALTLDSMLASDIFQTEVTTGGGLLTIGTGTFQAATTRATGSLPRNLISSDLDADGKIDLVTIDNSSDLGILMGNGDGTFSARTTIRAGANPYSVVAVDINADNKLDLISADFSGTTISIFIGNGNGTFQTRTTMATGTNPDSVVSGDFNGDGKIDLATSDRAANTLSIFIGNGNGTFATRTTEASGQSPYQVLSEDFNGDGKTDLLTSDSTANTVSFYAGNGDGTFAVRTTFRTGSSPAGVTAADLNSDGKLDVIVSDQSSATASILMGNGDGTFAARTTIAVGTSPRDVTAVDINSDDNLDLIVADFTSSTLSLALGNGNGTFATRTTIATGTNPYAVIGADLNNDDVVDLVSADNGSNFVSIFLANTSTTGAPEVTALGAATISIATQSDAENMLQIFDEALSYINDARANIGAIQSRLDFAGSVTSVLVENVSASRSQIIDTDIASETAELTRLQVLQTAGLAVLSQANMNSKLALKLLQNI